MAFLMSYFANKNKAAPSASQAAAKKTLSQLGIDDAAVPQASWSKLQMLVRSSSFDDLRAAGVDPRPVPRAAHARSHGRSRTVSSSAQMQPERPTLSLSASCPTPAPPWIRAAEDEEVHDVQSLAQWKLERDTGRLLAKSHSDRGGVSLCRNGPAHSTAVSAAAGASNARADYDVTVLVPTELLQTIFRLTDAVTIGRVAQVCTRWRSIAGDAHIQQQPGFKLAIRFAKYRTGQAEPDQVAKADGQINALIAAPDSTRIYAATGSAIRVVDLARPTAVTVLKGHTGMVCALAHSVDGVLYSGGFDKTIIGWDATGAKLFELVGHTGSVRALALSPCGKYLYSGGHDKMIRIWRLDGSEPPKVLSGHRSGVYAIAVSPSGDRIYSGAGSKDARIHVWTKDGELVNVLDGHQGGIFALATGPDGMLYSGSVDKSVRIWSKEGRLCRTVRGHRFTVQALAVHGDKVYSGSIDSSIRVMDRHSGQFRQSLVSHAGAVVGIAVDPAGRIYSGSHDKSILLW